jgi:putative peptidoglycan lipid II flippase
VFGIFGKNNFLKNGNNLFMRRQTNILSAATVLMLAIFASRILGLVRDRLLAGAFFIPGRQWQLDVYFAAFRLPDMLFQLLVLGALSAAFIPVFSKLVVDNERAAWRVASVVMNIGSLLFFILSLFLFIWAPAFSRLIAPNFTDYELSLMVNLTRLMLISQLFFIVSNVLTGILQSYQRFLLPALAPVVYNLGIIAGVIFLSPYLGIYGATIGVIIGAFLHFFIQLPLVLHLGMKYYPTLDLSNPYVRKIGKLMLPRTLALAVSQIELTVAVLIATSLSAGSLSIFYFAQHLNDVPVGLFGLTIGQAALPILSLEAVKDKENFSRVLIACLRQILFLALPASVLLLVLRIPLVRLAFGARTFPWEATILTGKVVALFSISIFAQASIQILVRAFYALSNTKTPFIIALLAVLVNVCFSFFLTFTLGLKVLGLALATTIASLFHTTVLTFLLQKNHPFLTKSNFLIPVGKIVLITSVTGFFLWWPMRILDKFILDTTRTIHLIILIFVVSLFGLSIYVVGSWLLKIEELAKFWLIFRRFGAWRQILASSSELIDGTKSSTSVTLSGKE